MKEYQPKLINNFKAEPISVEAIKVKIENNSSILNVVGVIEGSLLTKKLQFKSTINSNNEVISNPELDILKYVVLNRYQSGKKPAISFIQGFNLKQGAIAQSICHDSHNIICVGVSDEDIVSAINIVIKEKGAICVVNKGEAIILPTPIGGIMSNLKCVEICEIYTQLTEFINKLGCNLHSPFLTLAFMALSVIPEIKLTD